MGCQAPGDKSKRKVMLVDFLNLHVLVDGENGVANWGIGWRGCVMCCGGKFAAGAFDSVGVAFALGTRHGQGIRGDEFVDGSALSVEGDTGTFGLSDLQQVGADAGKVYGLRGGGARVSGWHFLQ